MESILGLPKCLKIQERQLEEERAERERLEARLEKAQQQLSDLNKDNQQLARQLEQSKLSAAEETARGSNSFDEAVSHWYIFSME